MHDLNGGAIVIGAAGDRCGTLTIVFGTAGGPAGLNCILALMRCLCV